MVKEKRHPDKPNLVNTIHIEGKRCIATSYFLPKCRAKQPDRKKLFYGDMVTLSHVVKFSPY